jgi:hypothetical protein
MRRRHSILAVVPVAALLAFGCGSSSPRTDGGAGAGGSGGRAGTGGAAGASGGAAGQAGRTDGGASDRLPETDGSGGAAARDGAADGLDTPDAESPSDAAAPCVVAIDGGDGGDGGWTACTNSLVSGNDNDFFCGLKADGRINCWASGPTGSYQVGPYGFLPPAIAKAPDHLVQLAVTNGTDSSNGAAFCGVDSAGRGTCWNGNGSEDMGGGLKAIVISIWGTCTLDSKGTVACGPEFVPMPASAIPYTKILASEEQIAALDEAGVPSYPNDTFPPGTYLDIGTNDNDRVGAVRSDGTAVSIVADADPIVKSGSFVHIALDYVGRACALDRAGQVTCWIAAPIQNPAPLGALPAGPFVQIVGATSSFCALRDTGTTTCWGDDPIDVPPGW